MMRTPLCHQLGIAYPIFSVGMGGSAGPELVAAVSNAGACGVLGAGARPASQLRERIRHLRTLTDKPFGVNILLPLLQEGQIETCLDEQIPLLVLFWGDPKPYVAEAHHRGIKVFIQVGSVEGGDFPWRGNPSPTETGMLVGSRTPVSGNYPRSENSL